MIKIKYFYPDHIVIDDYKKCNGIDDILKQQWYPLIFGQRLMDNLAYI